MNNSQFALRSQIVLTVRGELSLRIWRGPVMSFQNGIFTSRPPIAASSSNSGALSTIPDSPNLLSSAVRSIAYFSNSVGDDNVRHRG